MTSNEIPPGGERSWTLMLWAVVAGLALIVSTGWLANFVTSPGIDNPDPKVAIATLISRAQVVVSLATTLVAIALVVLAVFCALEGLSILRGRSYPPPGVRVLWQVRRRTGRAAALIGFGHLTTTALLLLMAAMGVWFLVRWPE